MSKETNQLLLVICSSIMTGIFVWLLMSFFESKVLNSLTFVNVLTASIVSSLGAVIIKDLDLTF